MGAQRVHQRRNPVGVVRTVVGMDAAVHRDHPQPVRGQRNEPAYVVHTLAALAQARGEDMDALGAQVDRNASACFRL